MLHSFLRCIFASICYCLVDMSGVCTCNSQTDNSFVHLTVITVLKCIMFLSLVEEEETC